MCGIAGIFNPQPQRPTLGPVIQTMTQSLRHRGPDDEGYFWLSSNKQGASGGNDTMTSAWNRDFPYAPQSSIMDCPNDVHLVMAHRRLSVIDLTETGHQPMCNEDSSLWMVCNGEIYNYIELRNELESMGYSFRSRSDSEVLLKAYEKWGERCLDKLNGMWAFVIYDRKRNILFGARDRFGVKPLYYYHKEFFAFASEQKALLSIPGLQTSIIPEAVYEHLLLGQVELRPEGFYRGIFELMPAHFFELDLETGNFHTQKYYHLSYFHEYQKYNPQAFTEFAVNVKDKMQQAVKLRLRSDVPVGFCLSGGLDSSSIVCISHGLEQEAQKLKTFTAVNGHADTDESRWATLVAEAVGAEAFTADCRAEDILPELDKMIWHQDVPLYSTSTFAQNRVMKSARENGAVILLDGQGGDELFAGYQTFYTSLLLEYMKKSTFRNFPKELKGLQNAPSSTGILFRSVVKLFFDKNLSPSQKDKMAARYKPELAYFNTDVRHQYSGNLSLAGEFSALTLNELLHKYFTDYYLKNLLRWEDRCSMQYSIESRTPFADDIELIEYVFSIPSSFKIRDGWSKSLMREAMKGILPEAVRLRKDKLGFATPQSAWLKIIRNLMRERIEELYPLDDLQMLDIKALLGDWERIFATPDQWKVQDLTWRYLNYLSWRKVFKL